MSTMNDTIHALAQRIWNYHQVNHILSPSDCILALGSHDTRVADRAAELFLEGMAPLLVFSGGLGNLTQGIWDRPEADIFAEIALQKGVPEEAILIENHSTNTGENIRFTHALLHREKRIPQSLILVQKPYMERRTFATFSQQWPGDSVHFSVTSPKLSMDAYPNEEISLDHVIHIMVGDLQRIRLYPEKGFQTYQQIPEPVWEAYEQLVSLGYTQHLINP